MPSGAGLVPLVRPLCGVRARLASSAEAAIWPRAGGALGTGGAPAEDRTLVRTWALRGTLPSCRPSGCGPGGGAVLKPVAARWATYTDTTLHRTWTTADRALTRGRSPDGWPAERSPPSTSWPAVARVDRTGGCRRSGKGEAPPAGAGGASLSVSDQSGFLGRPASWAAS